MYEYSINCAKSHLIITFRSEDLSVVTLSICRPCSVAKFTIIVFAARGSILELLETLGTKHRIMNKILLQYTMDFSATQRPTIFLDCKDCTMYVQCLAVHPKNKILVKLFQTGLEAYIYRKYRKTKQWVSVNNWFFTIPGLSYLPSPARATVLPLALISFNSSIASF